MEDFRWKKEEFKIDLDRHYDKALDISRSLPIGIVRFFEKNAQGEGVRHIIMDWISAWADAVSRVSSHADRIRYDLPTLCWYIITMRNDNNDSSVINSRTFYYGEKRRDLKRYGLEKCTREKEDMWSDPDGMMRQDYERYSSLYASHPDEMKEYSSMEEYLDTRYAAVRAWAADKTSDLVEYPFFSTLSDDKKAWDFMIDLAYNCYAGYNSTPLTRQPENTIRSGMFSGKSQESEMSVNKSDVSGYEIYDKHTVDSDGIQIEMTTVVGTFNNGDLDFSDDNRFVLRSELLDAKDNEIFRHIFSAFSVEDVNAGSKSFPLSEIVRSCYPRMRKEYYLDVIERLNKICIYRMEYVAKNSDGKVTEAGNLHFFDSMYHFPQDGQNERTVMTTNITSSTRSSFIDEIKNYDLKDVTIEVMPSITMQNSVRQKTNVAIFTDQYMKLPSSKAKSMAMYLQMHRTRAYPELFVMIPFVQVVQTHRLDKLRPVVQVKEIKGMIDQILDAQRSDKTGKLKLIESYTCDREYLKVNFIPFTEEECRRYGVRFSGGSLVEQGI